jgi:hypothetical protein
MMMMRKPNRARLTTDAAVQLTYGIGLLVRAHAIAIAVWLARLASPSTRTETRAAAPPRGPVCPGSGGEIACARSARAWLDRAHAQEVLTAPVTVCLLAACQHHGITSVRLVAETVTGLDAR